MKRDATQSKQANDNRCQSHAPSIAKVVDGRKQPIRGLWVRNGRYYAQLQFEDGNTGQRKTHRVPLLNPETRQAVTTVAQALEEMGRRFYADCAMGGASGWRGSDREGLRPLLKRTRETPSAVD
jgi:hypothetical protein